MLRIFYFLLGIALTALCLSTIVFSAVNVPSAEKDLKISHKVTRDSICDIESAGVGAIPNNGNHFLATVEIVNNTRDGFTLTLDTVHGELKPAGSDDGEISIDYDFYYDIGADDYPNGNGLFQELAIPTQPPITPTRILGVAQELTQAGDLLSEPTRVSFTLYVNVPDASEFNQMAGTYTDTVTISYVDF